MSENLFGQLIGRQSRKTRYNPRPPVPDTKWKRPGFPSLANAAEIMVDVETNDPNLEEFGPGWARHDGHVVGIAIGADDDYRAYYPIRHTEEAQDNFKVEDVIRYCQIELARKHQPKINHNIFYDFGWLREEGVQIVGPVICTQTAEWLLDYEAPGSLEALGQKYIGGGKTSYELLLWLHQYYGTGPATPEALKKQRANIHRTPPRMCAQYGEGDVNLPWHVWGAQKPLLEQAGMMNVFQLEMALLPLLVDMRFAGVSVDLEAAQRAREELSKHMDELYAELRRIVGYDFNPGSAKDVARYLSSQGIKIFYTGKGQPSITDEFLDEIDLPEAEMISEWRKNRKFRNTFLDGYILGAHVNGKIHGTFDPMGAKTGRMAAEKPNLQNLPSRDELAKLVRSAFIPDTGHNCWYKVDYASVEYRVFADSAVGEGAAELREQYNTDPDTDYHNYTMEMIAQMTGKTLERKAIKRVNFSILYGAQIKKLARILGMDIHTAEQLMNSYHTGLPYVRTTMDSTSGFIQRYGYSQTVCGRKVYFNEWEPRRREPGEYTPPLPYEQALRAYGSEIKRAKTYKGLNYRIQGSAADLMKAAMVLCYQAGIYDVTGPPRLVVHDENDFSLEHVEPNMMEALREMKHIMETAIPFKVPIRVDGEWGPNWSELYPFDP